jgi:hypothetical protein
MLHLNKTWKLIPINEISVNGSYIFSDYVEYPTNESFKIYAGDIDLHSRVPKDWIRITEFDNKNVQMTITDANGKFIHGEEVYLKRVSEGVMFAVATSARYDYRFLHFNTHFSGGRADGHRVFTESFRLVNVSQIFNMDTNQSVFVNGFYDTTLTASLDDEVDVVTDEHITQWKIQPLDGTGVTKMLDKIYTVVKLHNTPFIQLDYNIPIYLCSAIDCSVETTSNSPTVGLTITPKNKGDIKIISHQYIAINNELLNSAMEELIKHKHYNKCSVYLKWGIREYGNQYIPDLYHLGMLGNMDPRKALQILSGEVNELSSLRASQLVNRPLAEVYSGRGGIDPTGWRALGIPAMGFHYGDQIQYKAGTHSHWNSYVAIHYDSEGFLMSIEDASWDIKGDHYEIIPGHLVDKLEYVTYQGNAVPRTGRIYAFETNLIDLTDDTSKLDSVTSEGYTTYTAKSGYNNTLYYRNQQHIVVYEQSLTREEYLLGNVLIHNTYALSGLVIVWLNNRALLQGIDYRVKGHDIVITSALNANENILNFTVLIRPDVASPMLHTGYYNNGWDNPIVESMAEAKVGIITQGGKRNLLSNDTIENGLYTVEYPSVQEGHQAMVKQHEFDEELLNYYYLYHDKPESYQTAPDYEPPVDPFMLAMVNKILVTNDRILAEIDSYKDVALFCKNHEYLIDYSKRDKSKRSVYPVELTLNEHQYYALTLVSDHYNIPLNETNIEVI